MRVILLLLSLAAATTCRAGQHYSLETDSISFRGQVNGKFVYQLDGSRNSNGMQNLMSLSLIINKVAFQFPLEELQRIQTPHLGQLRIEYNDGGGVIIDGAPQESWSSPDLITVILPYSHVKGCATDNEPGGETPIYIMQFTLDGVLQSSEATNVCNQ